MKFCLSIVLIVLISFTNVNAINHRTFQRTKAAIELDFDSVDSWKNSKKYDDFKTAATAAGADGIVIKNVPQKTGAKANLKFAISTSADGTAFDLQAKDGGANLLHLVIYEPRSYTDKTDKRICYLSEVGNFYHKEIKGTMSIAGKTLVKLGIKLCEYASVGFQLLVDGAGFPVKCPELDNGGFEVVAKIVNTYTKGYPYYMDPEMNFKPCFSLVGGEREDVDQTTFCAATKALAGAKLSDFEEGKCTPGGGKVAPAHVPYHGGDVSFCGGAATTVAECYEKQSKEGTCTNVYSLYKNYMALADEWENNAAHCALARHTKYILRVGSYCRDSAEIAAAAASGEDYTFCPLAKAGAACAVNGDCRSNHCQKSKCCYKKGAIVKSQSSCCSGTGRPVRGKSECY